MTESINESYLELNEDFRITSDGRLNLILSQRYEKRAGVGKNAPLSGEYAFKEVGYYGGSLEGLIHRFNENEFLEVFGEVERGQDVLDGFKEMKEFLEEREKRIYNHIKEYVTLELKSTKDVNAKDE